MRQFIANRLRGFAEFLDGESYIRESYLKVSVHGMNLFLKNLLDWSRDLYTAEDVLHFRRKVTKMLAHMENYE
jgi:hypothetical protein